MRYKKRNYLFSLVLSVLIKLGLIRGKKKIEIFSKSLVIDLSLPGISNAIYSEKYREIDHTNIFSEKLLDKKKILDLGANIGYYMLLEATDSDKNSDILCIEPDPRNISLLKENIKINSLDQKVSVVEAVVSGKDGEVPINIRDASNLNKISENFIEDKNTILIKSMTLNSIFKNHGKFDCLRMDVEGAESEILSKNSDNFLNSMPLGSLIFMEIHPNQYIGGDDAMTDALNKIYNCGFKNYDIVTSGKKPHSKILNNLGKSENKYIDGKFNRFHYKNISFEYIKDFALHTPKIIRYIIAEKK